MAIYMHIPFSPGSVTAAGYVDWVEIDSLQWDVERSVAQELGGLTNRASGLPRLSSFVVTKATEDSSPGMLDNILHTQIGTEIKIAVTEAGEKPKEFVRYTIQDAMVTSYSTSASGESPHERIAFSYSKIEVAFTPHDTANKGNTPVRVSYDLANHK